MLLLKLRVDAKFFDIYERHLCKSFQTTNLKIVYEKSKAYIMFYMSYNSCMMFRQYGTENSKNRPIEADPDTLYGKS